MIGKTDANVVDEDRENGTYNVQRKASKDGAFVSSMLKGLLFLGIISVGLLVAIAVEVYSKSVTTTPPTTSAPTTTSATALQFSARRPPSVTPNQCNGKNPKFENRECVIDQINHAGEQSATNVTSGYRGDLETERVPNAEPYWKLGLCPINVHWHLGTEHYSLGQYDESGSGPTEINERRRLAGKQRLGYQCKFYSKDDPKFNTEYNWKFCEGMEVGQTYEVHWPHSVAGACGTLDQYQTPFYDGVFCRDGILNMTLLHYQVGVQAQVFTIVNDDSYFYPDLIRGMIVEGTRGSDIATYTGSTTGTTRDNKICSQYSGINWQVDRKCHLISASSFDKLCADMLSQKDDMTNDLHPHGSRELVSDDHAANNHQDATGFRG